MQEDENRLFTMPMKKLCWINGIPMVISMILQALYNIVDTAFVINMDEVGNDANLALTYAFPIQILMIAIGVGLGIGINAMISMNLGTKDEKAVSKACGSGIFLGLVFYVVFLLFGLFGSKPFIAMQAKGITDEIQRERVIDFGTQYLTICCTLSLGQMLFTVYERFLQATGRTMYSTIGQIAGAVTNIVLDYVMIYPCGLGVAGAAYATVIGQFVSLGLDMLFHYLKDKEIKNNIKDLIPNGKVIGTIFKIGVPAMIMQALLSLMMLGVNLILGVSKESTLVLTGSFGIYYKIQQIPLFGFFGMSNSLITIVSSNYGRKDYARVKEAMKHGVIDTMIISVILIVLFEVFAKWITRLFNMASGSSSDDVVNCCMFALRIASVGFLFMSFTISFQGVLQGLGKVFSPLILSALRLAVFLFPLAYLFSQISNPTTWFWFCFPISELLTSIIAFVISVKTYKSIGVEKQTA